jgi:hypothetical protein
MRHHRSRYRRDTAHHTAHHAAHHGGGARGGVIKRYWPWLVGGGILAAVFWPRSASAGESATPGSTAIVQADTGGGMNVRSAPAAGATKVGFVSNGSTVTVLETGHKASDGTAGEWWKIQQGSIVGFARAIDPNNYHNFKVA